MWYQREYNFVLNTIENKTKTNIEVILLLLVLFYNLHIFFILTYLESYCLYIISNIVRYLYNVYNIYIDDEINICTRMHIEQKNVYNDYLIKKFINKQV